jgi:tight adherence protein C
VPLYIYLASMAIGVSIPVVVWSLNGTRGYGAQVRRNLSQGIVRPVTSIVGRRQHHGRFLPQRYVSDIEHRLDRAGLAAGWPIERYIAAKVVAVVVALLLGVMWGIRLGGGLAAIVLPLVLVAAAWLLPDLQLSGKANELEKAIDIQLPDILDQLTISIEAGLGFDGAMFRLVERSTGPVVDQLARVLQDVRLGLARDDALRALGERTNSRDLKAFANAMASAGQHGLSMANVLRAQTAEVREKRKFRAEESALKVPVKILMPLVFCILPVLFIVMLGPAVIRYQDTLGPGLGG